MARGNTRLARQLLWFAAFADVALLLMMCSLAANGGWVYGLLLAILVNGSISWHAVQAGLLFELKKERTWRAVCEGIGYVGEATSYRNGVRGAMRGETKTVYPRLRHVNGTHESWTAIVRPFAGQTIDHYTKYAENFAFAFNVPSVTFEVHESGFLLMRAGSIPIPQAYSHPGLLDMPRPVGIDKQETAPLPVVPPVYAPREPVRDLSYELGLLKGVPVARGLNGQTCRIPIEGQHWLIAARTGGGKGSWLWSLVLGLAPAWRAGIVNYWGCDPKRLELAIGRTWWDYYADTDESIVELLETAVADMLKRTSALQGQVRKFTPSKRTPLNVIVLDELGYITTMMPDRKLRARAEQAITTLLMPGRAVGYSCVGAVLDPRKEQVGFRDLFPIRIAGALPGPMVDLVLGDGMYDAGARCDAIPLGDAGAGVAYVISETTQRPVCIRAAWCSDDAIRAAR